VRWTIAWSSRIVLVVGLLANASVVARLGAASGLVDVRGVEESVRKGVAGGGRRGLPGLAR
jgi:hypothetical protein